MSNVSILIPARAGSKRIPNKNIVDLGGKPLIYYVIKEALKITSNVYVSTDSPVIADISKSYGAKIIDRPHEYATDTSNVKDTIAHFLQNIKTDTLILLQPTSPFVKKEHIIQGINTLETKDSVISVCESREFYWNKAGHPINYDLANKPRTQDMEPLYKENGAFYMTRVSNFLKKKELVNGEVGFSIMPSKDSLDIDTDYDLKIARSIIGGEQ